MSYQINTMLPLENKWARNAIEEDHSVALEDIVRNSYSSTLVETASDKRAIDAAMQAPEALADPQKLLSLQNALGDYSLALSLASTLAKKAVSAIESVVKAQ